MAYNGKNKTRNIMRKDIWKILKDLENDKTTTNEAYHLLCDLFGVIKLVCDNCGRPIEEHSSISKLCPDRFAHFEQTVL